MFVKYLVEDMRVILPKGKVADKNPDRLATIHGRFFNDKGEELSFGSKEVTRADAMNPETVIDIDNGILILPAGVKGRKASVGISVEDIASLLDSVREAAE